MSIQLRQAERKKAKLRIGMFGPSGSGKTMSALLLAKGLCGDWSKIAIIDTENGSADLYSHLGPYVVGKLEAPFTPEKYIEAIRACENAGMEVIIVDSITHEWAGEGGILEESDKLGASSKNSFTVWGKLTPRHNRFIEAIVSSSVNMICCGRSKQDYVLNQVERNGKMVNIPEKVGLKSITREGFDYEMTVSFDLLISHYAGTTKDRTKLFDGKPEFVINEETGKIIKEWNESGAVDYELVKKQIAIELKRLGENPFGYANKEEFGKAIFVFTDIVLEEKNFEAILAKLKTLELTNKESKTETPVHPEVTQEETFVPVNEEPPAEQETVEDRAAKLKKRVVCKQQLKPSSTKTK